MKSFIKTLKVAAIMSLLISNITLAQESSEVGELVQALNATIEPASIAPKDIALKEGIIDDSGEYGEDISFFQSTGLSSFQVTDPLLRTGRKVFIVPAKEIKKEDHLAVERDMHVMSHIFDRVLKNPQMIGGVFIGGVFNVMKDFFGRDSHVTEAIYLDGYGALFFMEVNFALLGPSKSQEEKKPKEVEEQVDKIWKRAEQELFSPQALNTNRRTSSVREYDPETVENLKNNLITVLKHTANIQALKSDELVILTIFGRASQSGRTIGRSIRGRSGILGAATWFPGAKTSSFSTTVVTIRTKKSDIDAFSKGELDFDQFHERTQIITHWK